MMTAFSKRTDQMAQLVKGIFSIIANQIGVKIKVIKSVFNKTTIAARFNVTSFR